MNPLVELVEKLKQLVNSPYRNIFAFSEEEEAELDEQIDQEAKELMEDYLNH